MAGARFKHRGWGSVNADGTSRTRETLECRVPLTEDTLAETARSPEPVVSYTPAGFKPYVPDEAELPELTVRAVLLGALLGILFGASSVYLALRVGLTVSASVPIAVLSITFFRAA